MVKYFIALFFLAFSFQSIAQTIPSRVADWKNNAKGAYTIIHDDYGDVGVDGIWQYADTIAFNRGLQFTFGAISSSCEVARTIKGEASPYLYAKNVMIAQHKHEIINHSHTHTCAVNRGWSPCSGTGWGEIENTAAWNTQLHTSHQSILTNTGHQPRYYIYPYDQFTDEANSELASMGYLGSRTGWHIDGIQSPFYKYGYEANDENMFLSDANGFFRTSVQVFDDVDAGKSVALQTSELNSVVDAAIANNQWGNRELHNVGFSGWGYVKVDAYRNHLNYVKTKVASGDLWMGTVSEILTYQIQKLVYNSAAVYDASTSKITVSFMEDNSIVTADVGTYLSGLTIKTPVTVVLDLDNLTALMNFNDITVKQGATVITDYEYRDEKLFVNVYPHQGTFTIEDNALLLSNRNIHKNEKLNPAPSYILYPNPVTTMLSILNEDVHLMELYTVDGIKIMEVNGNEANVAGLLPGLYYLYLKELGVWKKFIKQ